jgi:hypothetical protein
MQVQFIGNMLCCHRDIHSISHGHNPTPIIKKIEQQLYFSGIGTTTQNRINMAWHNKNANQINDIETC